MSDTVDKIVIQSEVQGAQQTKSDLEGIKSGLDGVTVAAQSVEKSTGSVDSKFASLERRFSTTAGQAAQLAKVQQTVNAAVAANPALQDRADAVLAAATERYGAAIVAEKALGDAHAGLSAQGQAALHSIRSFGEQIALGIPPTQALTGQLNHLTFAATGEGGIKGAFGEVTGLIGGLLTPMRLAVGGAAALAVGGLYLGNSWSESSAQFKRAVIGIGAATGSTAADLGNFAKANSSATGLTIAEARDVAIEFTKTGDIAVKNLKGVGDAVHGYALLTGKDATQATKDLAGALSGDLVKGAEDLNKTYMALDSSALDYIQTLQTSGERAKAVQFIVDSIAPANLKAADSVGFLTKAYQALAGAMSLIKNGPPAIVTGNTPQQRLQQATTVRESAGTSFSNQLSGGFGSDILGGSDSVPIINSLDSAIKNAQKDVADFGGIGKEAFTKLSIGAKEATDTIFPQIEQIRQLKVELDKLQEAQSNGAAPGADAAKTAIQVQIDKLDDAQQKAANYSQRVAEISTQWGDVGQATALSLEAAKNHLPVLEAVGGAAKMAAQYTSDYATYMNQGADKTEAAALAASNLAAAQAQVNSSAKETLAALQDQAGVAAASNPREAAAAQAQATYNSLLRQGVDTQLAGAVADQQQANANEQIYQSVQKTVNASKDQLDLTRAQGTEYEKVLRAQIASQNALDAGATLSQASAIYSNTLATETIKAERAAEQLAVQLTNVARAEEAAQRAAHDAQFTDITPGGDNSFSFFQTKSGIEGNTVGTVPYWQQKLLQDSSVAPPNAATIANNILSSGGNIDSALSAIQNLKAGTTTSNSGLALEAGLHMQPGQLGLSKSTTISQSDIISLVGQLYDAKNAQTSDKSQQAANLQQEVSWLQNQPQTLDTLTAINNLKTSIASLTTSTNNLNSTNKDLLSPYYSQDPRTSHIGFRSQGMATGGELTVPGGYSANDNMLAQIPVASGEIISVRRPGQDLGGTTQNTYSLGGIHITVMGGATQASANAIGRTAYQAAQLAMRQLQASSR